MIKLGENYTQGAIQDINFTVSEIDIYDFENNTITAYINSTKKTITLDELLNNASKEFRKQFFEFTRNLTQLNRSHQVRLATLLKPEYNTIIILEEKTGIPTSLILPGAPPLLNKTILEYGEQEQNVYAASTLAVLIKAIIDLELELESISVEH